tara:strand:+ start:211 stop:771 length:561 start_codon:yes stop_codon:yes gene_type:complete
MEDLKRSLGEADEAAVEAVEAVEAVAVEATKPIDIPKVQPEPAINQMDFLVNSMKEMEARLAEANKPKVKAKRVASEKQKANLENARAARAVITAKKNAIKLELKKEKIQEKKLVNQKIKDKLILKEDADNNDSPVDIAPVQSTDPRCLDGHPNVVRPVAPINPNDVYLKQEPVVLNYAPRRKKKR